MNVIKIIIYREKKCLKNNNNNNFVSNIEKETIFFFLNVLIIRVYIHKTALNHGNARLPELNLIAAASPYSSYRRRRPGVKMVARLIVPNTRGTQRRGLSAGWRGGGLEYPRLGEFLR